MYMCIICVRADACMWIFTCMCMCMHLYAFLSCMYVSFCVTHMYTSTDRQTNGRPAGRQGT